MAKHTWILIHNPPTSRRVRRHIGCYGQNIVPTDHMFPTIFFKKTTHFLQNMNFIYNKSLNNDHLHANWYKRKSRKGSKTLSRIKAFRE